MDHVYAFLVRTLTEKFEVAPEAISATATLGELDLDSLEIVELTDILQEYCGTPLEEDELRETSTLSDLVQYVGSQPQTA
ncbi:phosphopantetheine-binding protein [Streptomyces sp. NBC_00090]|uniref:acyl carrier protein n=1 Tax=Streptomyces sp. NBC_00090 TaxID=2903619 RepID=UPI0032479CDF